MAPATSSHRKKWSACLEMPPKRSLPPLEVCFGTGPIQAAKAGVWDRLMDAITAAYDGDIEMIDSSVVRVHKHVANTKKAVEIVAWAAAEEDWRPRSMPRSTGAAFGAGSERSKTLSSAKSRQFKMQ